MNEMLEAYARQYLKDGLAQCTDAQQLMFKRMYAHGRLEMPINDAVDGMPIEKLDWAMVQLERTLARNNRKAAE